MALSTSRLTTKVGESAIPDGLSYPVKASVKIFAGSLVVLQAGYAKPGVTGTGLVAAGRAESTVDNSAGSDGDLAVAVRQGVFIFANGSTSITQADVGADCYIVDDQTVHQTSGGGARSVAGRILGVDSQGVHVQVGMAAPAGNASTLIQGGTTTLVAGTKTVSGVTLTANSRILVTRKTPGGTIGKAGLDAPSASRDTSAGTFVINAIDDDKSTSVLDTSTVDWLIFG